MDEVRVLGEEVVSEGQLRRVRRYVAGWHPRLGKLHWGLQGKETIVEADLVVPLRTFKILPREES